jgi:DNA-binding transcriptional LysR family regulator
MRVAVTQGSVELQIQQLRTRHIDALVVDMRVVPPSPDLHIEPVAEMAGGWLVRTGHPLLQRRSVGLADVLAFPVASNPLSDEVTRAVVAQYGPQANPAQMITLECNDLESLIDVAERTDTVLLCVLAAARERIKTGAMAVLPVRPTLQATARFAYVTLVGRSQAPVMGLLRDFVTQRLAD